MLRTLAVFLAFASGPAMADLQSCQKLFATVPQVLDEVNNGRSHNYEDDHPGLGYSFSFVDSKTKLTVFFYDHQQQSISPAMALESFKEAARDMHTVAKKRGSKLSNFNAYQVGEQSQLFRLQAESESRDGKSEFLALGIVDNCIVKIRFTAHFSMDEAKRRMNVILRNMNQGFG